MKATAKDLRFHSKELLDTARRGEEVLITYRGKPYAKLVPVTGELNIADSVKNNLFGIWSDYTETEDVGGYVDNLRKGRF
ncbi:MAG: type II toxin-antitoxin system prevent-host-death family antitoxin [Candidatus Marinimicrobia bacterium]|nr:type II toxin-antitoxin system prevent-host-death family antitoxin [Candidatus Neomarinimicrobiota bacterium]